MEGKWPFHLLMRFDVSDLSGKAQEQGTIEYWWAGARGSKLDITAPSLGTVHDGSLEEVVGDQGRRTLYLATQLLDAERFGAAGLKAGSDPSLFVPRAVGQAKLKCMAPLSSSTNSAPTSQDRVCVDEQNGAVRLVETPNHLITRNRIGTFAGTHVALDEDVLYGHVLAIKGHIEKLESFDPVKTPVALQASKDEEENQPNSSSAVKLGPKVLGGKKIGGPVPEYPAVAKAKLVEGTVVLAAEISKEGRIAWLVPVASPDPLLTESAKSAVSRWTYHPYLLNGSPTAVSSTITVNFNLNSRFQLIGQ